MRERLRHAPGSHARSSHAEGAHTVEWRYARSHRFVREPEPVSHDNMVGLLVAAAGALGLAAAVLLPATLILPAVSLIALGGAACVALFARWTGAQPSTTPRLGAWDVAGVLALIGFGAGMISDPVPVLQLFGAPTPDL